MIILNKPNIWGFIWDLSEFLHISLGSLAPYVFERMMGFESEKIAEINNRNKQRN